MARLDARNLICPMPVIRTQEYIKGLAAGDELEVVATDPGALQDIPAWCRIHGHEILSTSHDCRDAGGRATQDAKADDCRDAGGRATQDAKADDCRDAGGRATQDARADDPADIHIRIRVGAAAAQK